MQIAVTDLNFNEILLYLGYKGSGCPDEIRAQILACEAKVKQAAAPLVTFQLLPVADGHPVGLEMPGKDIPRLLADCSHAIVFAATLGIGVDNLIRRTQALNMADAVIMDAVAGAAIENVCNNFTRWVQCHRLKEGEYLTDRFSPGYGDLPLAVQADLCRLLKTDAAIGLTLTPAQMMVPFKSVTAIMGIAGKPQTMRASGCENCNLFLTCTYRAQGGTCHE